MTSGRRGRGVLSHTDFFYSFGQSLHIVFFLTRKRRVKFLYFQAAVIRK